MRDRSEETSDEIQTMRTEVRGGERWIEGDCAAEGWWYESDMTLYEASVER